MDKDPNVTRKVVEDPVVKSAAPIFKQVLLAVKKTEEKQNWSKIDDSICLVEFTCEPAVIIQ